jgi:hypothetical protein
MAVNRNADNTTGFYYESGTYANASGGLQWIGAVQEFSATDDPQVQPIRYHGTATRNVNQFVSTGKRHTGTVSFYPQDWKTVLFALGSCVDTSGSTSTHVISELDGGNSAANVSGTENPFYSFQLYHHKNVPGTGVKSSWQYAGAVCNTWTLNVPQGGILSVDMGWIAQSVTYGSGTVASITENTTRPFVSSDVKLHLPSGTVISLMNTATLSINNNFDAKQYANASGVIGVPIPGARDYMLDTGLDASSERNKALFEQYLMGGSEVNALLDVTVSASRYAYFTMSGGRLVTLETNGGTEGTVTQTFGYQPKSLSVSTGDVIPKYNAW